MARGTGPQKWLLVAWECPLPLAALPPGAGDWAIREGTSTISAEGLVSRPIRRDPGVRDGLAGR